MHNAQVERGRASASLVIHAAVRFLYVADSFGLDFVVVI